MTEAEIPLEEDNPELVHWFDRPPVTVSVAEATGAMLGAFTLGVFATIGLLAVTGHLKR